MNDSFPQRSIGTSCQAPTEYSTEAGSGQAQTRPDLQAKALENFRDFERWGRRILKRVVYELDLDCKPYCFGCHDRFKEGEEAVDHDGELFCQDCAPKYFIPAELKELGL